MTTAQPVTALPADPASTDPASTDPASTDPRADRVAAAVKSWQRTLVDLGGRNTLLWYRDLPSGTLDLTTAHPGGVSKLLAGKPTRLSELVREPAALDEARRRARAIRAKALELREERGIAAGFIAIGMATWSVQRAPRPPAAPVLLRSCVLRPTGAAQEDFEVDLGPEVELNPVLREYLRSEQGIEVDGESLADLATVGAAFDPYPAYAALDHSCAAVPEWTISPRLVIGTFSYAKLPMVADLALQGDSLADHDVVAALAGDEGALAAVRMRVPESEPDADPEHEHLVLDADASQRAAIDAVRAGAHVVIKGPPGTGKSQTIANLIASLAAEGKSTLFVAEKRAAIDAVLGRLDRLGLGDLVLDAYDGTTNRRAVARQFASALDAALDEDLEIDALGVRTAEAATASLVEHRSRLVRHVEALHRVREPWGVTAHEVQEALVELTARTPPPTSHVRLDSAALAALSRTRVVEIGRRLRDVCGLGAWTQDGEDPWYGARILTSDDAGKALEVTRRYSGATLDELTRYLNAILAESRVPEANTLADWTTAFDTMARVHHTLEVFRPEVFDVPLTEPIAATATSEWREANAAQMGWLTRWRVRSQTKRLLRPGRPPERIHDELVAAAEQRKNWYALVGGGGRPEISPRLEEGLGLLAGLRSDLDWLKERLRPARDGRDLTRLPLGELRDLLAQLASRPERIAVLPQVTTTLDELRTIGLGPLIDDLAARGVATDDVSAEVEHVWWASLAQEITVRDPSYGAHNGDGLRRDVADFVAADRAYQQATVARVRAAVARSVREVIADHPAHEALVRAEAGRARRHKPLRDLMPQASATLTAIKPCWAMSPLVVASTLPPGRWFDVVIFDEASQVQPAQAISAISRARQVVVSGDERQLPPTNFFTVVSDDESAPSDETLTEGFESILDVLTAALPTRRLTWHYRSRDERLIAFANETMYNGALTTFPGTSLESAVTFEPVEGVADVQPGAEAIETTDTEVARVVELVLEHARTRPDESLGVIALGIKHAERLDDAIRVALRTAPDVAGFFADDREERFFVKNLERVQGDERDAIILSVGYGKTPHGRVLHRFGPLNNEGGERRLNVAITRARVRMAVVSALRASDLDPERLKATGALMLRDFLAYAESRGDALPGPSRVVSRPAATDPLRHDLAGRLRREGLVVHEDFGNALQRIDLAVEDPYHRGRALLAIETDGPRYAALRGTRDRDRLRPEQLERLGWVHLRVWSTDVFRDPAREISRILSIAREIRTAPVSAAPDRSGTDEPVSTDQLGTTEGPGTAGHSGSAEGGIREDGAVTDEPAGPGPEGKADGREETAPVTAEGAPEEPEAATSRAAETASEAQPHASREVPAKPQKRKRRRVFRKGTAAVAEDAPGSSRDDTDIGWGERPADGSDRDRWLQEQRPPHYE